MHYLRAATPREIIARMLRNLQEIYRAQGDVPRLKAVQDRLDILLPEAGELSQP
jgi:regulator of sirC expression with transglutaminase-like and TPR domain